MKKKPGRSPLQEPDEIYAGPPLLAIPEPAPVEKEKEDAISLATDEDMNAFASIVALDGTTAKALKILEPKPIPAEDDSNQIA